MKYYADTKIGLMFSN